MDVEEAIRTRLEVREFTDEAVDGTTKLRILNAARLAPSGINRQHWRFILVEDDDDLERLADISETGGWVAGAGFAVVVVTDPSFDWYEIDAGRAITHMQFAAWDAGIGSCIYTGFDDTAMRTFLDIPDEYAISVVVGFGHPTFDVADVAGHKDRAPLSELVFAGRFGMAFEE